MQQNLNFKHATSVSTSKVTKNADLASLKTEIDKLDVVN